jgi:predicted NBD/HSP70 family sugar kinase
MARLKPGTFPPLSLNERRILDVIRRRNSVSRVEIAKMMDLTGASVTRIIQSLEARGLLLETTSREGKRGQPTRPLQLRPDAAYAIGFNFSHSSLDVALVDFTGAEIGVVSTSISDPSFESIVLYAKEVSDQLLASKRIRRNELVGVGISVPGYRSEIKDHFALHPTFSTLMSRNLAKDFRGPLDMRVIVERDAIAAAIGEGLVGHGRDRSTFGFVHLGHGIGGALILNGEPYRGAFGNAGGIGDLFPRNRNRPSGSDLLAHLRSHGHDLRDFAELESLSDSARTVLDDWIEQAGVQLRDGLAVFARIVDPQAIIIGGRLPKFICRKLVDRITPLPRPDTYTEDLPQPLFEVSTHGPLSGAIGAACLPLFERFFSMAYRE